MSDEVKFLEMLPDFGRPPKFKTPQQLYDKFVEYVRTVDAMPIRVAQSVKQKGRSSGENKENYVNLVAHPLSLTEFCLFAGISNWSDFKTHKRNRTKYFAIVIARIEAYLRNQQVNGAMAGLYNANIVARLNGITERTELTGKDGAPLVPVQRMTDEEIDAELERLRKCREH